MKDIVAQRVCTPLGVSHGNTLFVCSHLLQVLCVQMLQEGFYHSDPHPGEQRSLQATAACVMLIVKYFMTVVFVVAGNLFRTADGRLAYIDFGMMGEIEPPVRRCVRHAVPTMPACVAGAHCASWKKEMQTSVV